MDVSSQQAAIMTAGAIEAMTPRRADDSDDRDVTFWLVRTMGGTGLRPPTSEHYTVRASAITTNEAESGGASTMHERLLVEADESGIRALERALRESGGVQSVDSEPAPDGDYLDEDHSGVVTVRHGQTVDD